MASSILGFDSLLKSLAECLGPMREAASPVMRPVIASKMRFWEHLVHFSCKALHSWSTNDTCNPVTVRTRRPMDSSVSVPSKTRVTAQVVVVDDIQANLDFLTEILAQQGFQTFSALARNSSKVIATPGADPTLARPPHYCRRRLGR